MLKWRSAVSGLLVLAWTGSTWALGLGEIEARSKLNQPLLAQIPISTSTPAELDSLVVSLASNEAFDRAGMERSEYLSSLRFDVQGSVIRVRSKDIAREPFVSFLLDVRWKGGRLLREYTLLLDPPTFAQQPSAPASAPARAPAANPMATAPAPAAPSSGMEPATTEAPAAESAVAASPAAASAPAPAPASGPMVSGDSYGPVLPQETLWSIAYKLRPDPNSITMDQMQVALLNANPQAFKDGQLTSLLKGSVLRVPTLAEIQSVDPVAAKAQVAAARSASYAPPAAASGPRPEPVTEAAPKVAPAPPPAPVAQADPPPPEPKVEPKPEPAPEVAQAPPAPPPSAVAPPPSEVSTPAPAATEPPPPTEQLAQAPPPAESPPPAEPAATPAPSPEPAAAAAPVIKEQKYEVEWTGFLDRGREFLGPYALPAAAGFLILVTALLGFGKLRNKYAQWSYKRASRKIAETSAAIDKTQIDRTQIDRVGSMDEAATVVNTGSAPSLAETQAVPAAPQMAATQAMVAPFEATMQQTVQQEPAASASGARAVDFDVTGQYASETVQINLDAGDPVSEAEFHRAYGLYDEAALLLKQALQKEPKRTEVRVKLAEIYFESSKASEFVAVATELKGQLPDAEWQKIALMGSQIAPQESLFSGAAAAGAGTIDLSFDEPAAPAAAPAAPAAKAAPKASAPAADDGMLEFKLEDAVAPAAAPAAPAPAAASAAPPGGDALEFDLGGLSLDTPAAAAPDLASPPSGGDSLNMEALDLGSFDLGDAPAGDLTVVTEGAAEAGGDDASTKLDLARAYVDMGDKDMATGLLNEVMQQGNEQQKKEAAELLQRVQA